MHYALRERPTGHELLNGPVAERGREGPIFVRDKKKQIHITYSEFQIGRRLQSQRLFQQTLVQNAFFLRNRLAGFGAEYEEANAGGLPPFSDPHLRSDRGFENKRRPFTLPQSSTR